MPLSNGRFASLDAPLSDARTMKSLRSDFIDWGYRNSELSIRANTKLKVYAGPDTDIETFEQMCEDAAAPLMEAEMQKTMASFDKKTDALEKKLRKEERELEMDKEDLSSRKKEEAVRHLTTVVGLLGIGGRRRRSSGLSSSMSKRRMTSKAKADVEESEEAIEEMQQEIANLDDQEKEALAAVNEKWEDIIDDIEEESISPLKKDVMAELFGVAWMPYFVVDVNGRSVELPAFNAELPL